MKKKNTNGKKVSALLAELNQMHEDRLALKHDQSQKNKASSNREREAIGEAMRGKIAELRSLGETVKFDTRCGEFFVGENVYRIFVSKVIGSVIEVEASSAEEARLIAEQSEGDWEVVDSAVDSFCAENCSVTAE